MRRLTWIRRWSRWASQYRIVTTCHGASRPRFSLPPAISCRSSAGSGSSRARRIFACIPLPSKWRRPAAKNASEAPPQTIELPADLLFSARLQILSALTQGPAVTSADRRHPLRRGAGSPPNRPCHSEVAGQGTACKLWSGYSRRYASGKLGSTVKVLAPESASRQLVPSV